ncbi:MULTISPECIES: hypothetical protein [Actinoalloteichus]|uniref:PE domain-containing protein n=1 Tax=Actinoalloteichus fjordicus TaxID=1612552 RepID=A0AAC9PPQ2_9PSEU|nr:MULTISPECIES: hypothetical protein [Actinoalloteichus]APU12289.1 hypothetical protein UA74_00980 [Actinoalloteichus fjordicus]APU18241.1 hypothetical protein UA75_00980 [Actinoalloteichus sp. GBA129-24]
MSDGYEIDLERAPQILANLKEARWEVMRLLTAAGQLAAISFRGSDMVSRHATAEMHALTLDPANGSLFQAVESYLQAIDDQIASLEQTLLNYHTIEELNSITGVPIGMSEVGD